MSKNHRVIMEGGKKVITFPSCVDCKFHRVWDPDQASAYHHICEAPQLQNLIGGHPKNKGVRCQETREFKFACGEQARWFIAKE